VVVGELGGGESSKRLRSDQCFHIKIRLDWSAGPIRAFDGF